MKTIAAMAAKKLGNFLVKDFRRGGTNRPEIFPRNGSKRYDFECCITGLAVQELRRGRIVPWRADSSIRLNPRNGLCLLALHDRAFDQGLITISESFHLLLRRASPSEAQSVHR